MLKQNFPIQSLKQNLPAQEAYELLKHRNEYLETSLKSKDQQIKKLHKKIVELSQNIQYLQQQAQFQLSNCQYLKIIIKEELEKSVYLENLLVSTGQKFIKYCTKIVRFQVNSQTDSQEKFEILLKNINESFQQLKQQNENTKVTFEENYPIIVRSFDELFKELLKEADKLIQMKWKINNLQWKYRCLGIENEGLRSQVNNLKRSLSPKIEKKQRKASGCSSKLNHENWQYQHKLEV